MTAMVWLAGFGAACGGIGYLVGRARLERDGDGTWLPPARRRWRP